MRPPAWARMFLPKLTFPSFHLLPATLVFGKCHKILGEDTLDCSTPSSGVYSKLFLWGPDSKYLDTSSQLRHCGRKAATDGVEVNDRDRVPIKSYLLKHVADCIGFLGPSLPNLTVVAAVESPCIASPGLTYSHFQVLGAMEAESSQLKPPALSQREPSPT